MRSPPRRYTPKSSTEPPAWRCSSRVLSAVAWFSSLPSALSFSACIAEGNSFILSAITCATCADSRVGRCSRAKSMMVPTPRPRNPSTNGLNSCVSAAKPQRRPQRADVPQERHHHRSRARARPQIARTRAALDQNASFAKRVVSQCQQSRAFEPTTRARVALSLARSRRRPRARSFARSFVRARDPLAPRATGASPPRPASTRGRATIRRARPKPSHGPRAMGRFAAGDARPSSSVGDAGVARAAGDARATTRRGWRRRRARRVDSWRWADSWTRRRPPNANAMRADDDGDDGRRVGRRAATRGERERAGVGRRRRDR